jgi:hypothetical protein
VPFQITLTDEFLQVTVHDRITLSLVQNAILEILSFPEYLEKNDLWIFGDSPVAISYEEFPQLVRFIRQHYPTESKHTKTALVVPPGFTEALAALWMDEAGSLPYQIAMFHSRDAAVTWITQP